MPLFSLYPSQQLGLTLYFWKNRLNKVASRGYIHLLRRSVATQVVKMLHIVNYRASHHWKETFLSDRLDGICSYCKKKRKKWGILWFSFERIRRCFHLRSDESKDFHMKTNTQDYCICSLVKNSPGVEGHCQQQPKTFKLPEKSCVENFKALHSLEREQLPLKWKQWWTAAVYQNG